MEERKLSFSSPPTGTSRLTPPFPLAQSALWSQLVLILYRANSIFNKELSDGRTKELNKNKRDKVKKKKPYHELESNQRFPDAWPGFQPCWSWLLVTRFVFDSTTRLDYIRGGIASGSTPFSLFFKPDFFSLIQSLCFWFLLTSKTIMTFVDMPRPIGTRLSISFWGSVSLAKRKG